jgi:hypothetical protein
MPRLNVFLSAPVERLFKALQAITYQEHPSLTCASLVISDALFALSTQKLERHFRDHGTNPKVKSKLEELASILQEHEAAAHG